MLPPGAQTSVRILLSLSLKAPILESTKRGLCFPLRVYSVRVTSRDIYLPQTSLNSSTNLYNPAGPDVPSEAPKENATRLLEDAFELNLETRFPLLKNNDGPETTYEITPDAPSVLYGCMGFKTQETLDTKPSSTDAVSVTVCRQLISKWYGTILTRTTT